MLITGPGCAVDDRRIHVEDGLAARRHHHGQARIVREGGLRALRVLRAWPQLRPTTMRISIGQRISRRTCSGTWRPGDDLFHRQEGEISADVRRDRIVSRPATRRSRRPSCFFHQRHVEHARAAPYFSASPVVEPKMPLKSSTPWPMMNVLAWSASAESMVSSKAPA